MIFLFGSRRKQIFTPTPEKTAKEKIRRDKIGSHLIREAIKVNYVQNENPKPHRGAVIWHIYHLSHTE
jgi:hypothetical protein